MVTAVEPRRGLRFEHARMRPSIAGVRFEDSPRSVCRVTKVDRYRVYYRTVDDDGSTGTPWWIRPEAFPGIVHRVLPDLPPAERPAATLRIAMVGGTGAWRGAIRQGSRTLADCGHNHANRDSGYSGSARQCITTMVRAARTGGHLADAVLGAAAASAAQARRLGARITDEEARAKASATLDQLRDILAAHPEFHLPRPPGIFTPGIVCGCCRPTEES